MSFPPPNYFDAVYNRNSSKSANRTDHTFSEERMAGFGKFVGRYEINNTFASKLKGLDGYEIVFICDDSGSMNTELSDVPGPYNQSPTRWDELKQTVSIVVDLASVLDPDGVDVYFLNREPIFNVRNSKELKPVFTIPPEGFTPIARVLRQVLRDKRKQIHERKLLILLATDGEPTDDDGYPEIDELRRVLKYERNPIDRIPVTIIACTDDNGSMAYLNNWDRAIPKLDVVDDYKSEKQEILQCQGASFPFSFGDYVVKILMGGVDSWFDKLDEEKVSMYEHNRSEPRKTTTTSKTKYQSPYPSVPREPNSNNSQYDY